MNKEDAVHIYNEILLSHKKEWNLDICDNMDGPRGYYANKKRKTEKDNDFTYEWNLKNKTNEQT